MRERLYAGRILRPAWGKARVSYLDVRDLASVAGKALEGGEHDGKTYELNGPEAVTYTELADRITKQTGVAANYVDIPVDAQRKAMLDQGMPEWQVTALLDLQAYYTGGQGGTTDGLLTRLLGREPIMLDQFLKKMPPRSAVKRQTLKSHCEDRLTWWQAIR